MSDPGPISKAIEVTVLVRGIPFTHDNGDVAAEVYKAVVIALHDRYAVMGYTWKVEFDR